MKKLIAIVLTALMLLSSVLALASCGGVNAADDLKKVKAAGKLVVGMECAYAPYNWAQPSASEYTVKLSNNTYADGYDVQIARKIAEWLNDCGLRTVKGNVFTARAIRAILSNPVYCGDVVFHRAGRVVRDHHEALVSRELWETVNGTADKETSKPGEIAA